MFTDVNNDHWHLRFDEVAKSKYYFEVFLSESGLVEADVPGWRYVDPFSLNMLLGFEPEKRVQSDGIAIPYTHLDGTEQQHQGIPFYRVRLLKVKKRADGKDGAKYLSPNGADVHVYIPKRTRLSIQAGTIDTLVITEGEKKAELLAKFGVDAVALPGISMGQVRKNPENKSEPRVLVQALIDLIDAALGHGLRACVVLFDAEGRPRQLAEGEKAPEHFVDLDKKKHLVVRNPNVYYEAVLLARSLRERFVGMACNAMWAELPVGWPLREGQDPHKAGVDDWALSVGEQAVVQAIAEVSARAKRITEEEKAERDRRRAAMDEEGYHPLGMESGKGGEPIVVLWSKRNGKMVRMDTTDMSKQATWLGVFGPSYARENWPKRNKEGEITSIDLLAAQSEIFSACQAKKEWSSSRERGGGVWAEEDGLFINAREGLFRCDSDNGFVELSDEHRHIHRNIYPRAGDFSIGIEADNITRDFLAGALDFEQQKMDIDTLIRHFQQWGGMSEFHSAPAMLLAGWIAASSVLGALTARPSMMISGESGAGKSVLAEHISEVLGKTALRIDDGASATEPGIRQKLGKDSRALLLDEAEPGSSNASVSMQRSSNLRRILNLLRAAYQTSDSENTDSVASLKGSSDGKAVDYSLRTSAILFAIGKPDLEQADLNRTIMVELRKDNRAKSIPSNKGLHELGIRIRFAMWSHWNDFRAILAHIHNLCADPTYKLGVEARLANTWGVPIAALLCFAQLAVRRVTEPESMSEEDAQRIDNEIVAILSNVRSTQRKNQSDAPLQSDADRALESLLTARVSVEILESWAMPESAVPRIRRADRRVIDALNHARREQSLPRENRYTEQSLLTYGLKYCSPEKKGGESTIPEGFAIYDNSQLRLMLAGTPFQSQNITTLLLRLTGSVTTRRRFGKELRCQCVFVPFDFDGEELDDI